MRPRHRLGVIARRRPAQRGAALLSALLLMTLVASLAAGALWQQWRVTEVEQNERGRQQAHWILQGASDWARLILVEDIRSAGTDHLNEPWAMPLQEARLSSFLASGANVSGDDFLQGVFLSGRIEDMQGRLNLRNLVDQGRVSQVDLQSAERLFVMLDLPASLAAELAARLSQAPPGAPSNTPSQDGPRGFSPQRPEHLVWLGLSTQQIRRLAPHISLLPERTPLNLNTASAELLHACIPGLSLGDARRLAQSRELRPWENLAQAQSAVGPSVRLAPERFALASKYFQVTGTLRQEDRRSTQQALVRRQGLEVRVLWRHNQAQLP